jgi:DNA-binding HxlR family transcriptional regulator
MKGKRTNLEDSPCGIARSLQIVGDWWTLLIVRDAFKGAERFGEFQKSLGLAKNILSTRLKKLVEERIFRIEAEPGSATGHRYLLTPKGEKLGVVLVALWQWGEEHCFKPGELDYQLVDPASGKPLEKLRLAAEHQYPLGPRDFRVVKIAADERGVG